MSGSSAELGPPRIGNLNKVFKSGPLLISSKAMGWRSWKKRWFVLTCTSLVFFKNDPSSPVTRNGEANIALGGINLNNSGSIVVRENKKLITVLFPDGRDGREFTLKAETTQDMYLWKLALEHALDQAPNPSLVIGSNGVFTCKSNEGGSKRLVKSLVSCPIFLALKDEDGSPSFLEKALGFLETYGVKIEGILRLSADVEEVYKRIEDYEQGNTEFHPNEDAHVIGDCVKYVLRELPSSPIPASCCSALLAASRIDWRETRINALSSAIQEKLPEPNKLLLRRIVGMMRTISSHSSENRMVPIAVASCMAPLLLRPLFSAVPESGYGYSMNGDTTAQLLAASNAANNARTILTMLLEEYENIFDDGENQNDRGSEISTNYYNFVQNDIETCLDGNRVDSGTFCGISCSSTGDHYNYKPNGSDHLHRGHPPLNHTLALKVGAELETMAVNKTPNSITEQIDQWKKAHEVTMDASAEELANESQEPPRDALLSSNQQPSESILRLDIFPENAIPILPQKLSDNSKEEAFEILRLAKAKNELQQRLANEARGNAILHASLEKKRQALLGRRVALEQDVARLRAQLEAERDLRSALQIGLAISPSPACMPSFHVMETKALSEIEEIALAEADVAKLKKKVFKLYSLLIQRNEHPHEYQQKCFHRDFDSRLGAHKHERKRVEAQRFSGPGNIKVRIPTSPGSMDRMSTRGYAASMASPRSFMSDYSAPSTAHLASPSRASETVDYRGNPSLSLIELTTRLDFFKERRGQLMEQLHNLDLKKCAPS